MNKESFTLEQAQEIAEDFEDLIDTDVVEKEGVPLTVTHVVVCPYDEEDKTQFAADCVTDADQPEKLLLMYDTDEYDVIIISQEPDTEGDNLYDVTDIRSYISQNGVNYNFPE